MGKLTKAEARLVHELLACGDVTCSWTPGELRGAEHEDARALQRRGLIEIRSLHGYGDRLWPTNAGLAALVEGG